MRARTFERKQAEEGGSRKEEGSFERLGGGPSAKK